MTLEEESDKNLPTSMFEYFSAKSGLRNHRRQLAQNHSFSFSASSKRLSKLRDDGGGGGAGADVAKAFKKIKEERII